MDLSIIIPIFNTDREKMKRCFDSVRGIEALEFECLLIDDGSEAFVGEFCRGYAKEDPRFVYYRQENAGVSAARNAGIDMAKGEYICFVDSDDMIFPDAYNTPGLLDGTTEMIVTDLIERVGEKEERWYAFDMPGEISHETAIKRLVKDGNWNGPYCKFIKLAFLKEKNIKFPVSMIQGEDAVFLCSVLENRCHIKYSSIVSYLYFHTYFNGSNRFSRAPMNCIEDASSLYFKVMQLIDRTCLSEYEINRLKVTRSESYINELFGRALDSIECQLNNSILQEAIRQRITSFDSNITKKFSKISMLKLLLLRSKNWFVLRIISLIRSVYFKLTGLR